MADTPLFFEQNEARRAEKIFFGDRSLPPLSQGLDDRPHSPYHKVWIPHCLYQAAISKMTFIFADIYLYSR